MNTQHNTPQLQVDFVLRKDALHEWLEVPYPQLALLHIDGAITESSRLKDNVAYLDHRDMIKYIQAWLRFQSYPRTEYAAFWRNCRIAWDGYTSPIVGYPEYEPNL